MKSRWGLVKMYEIFTRAELWLDGSFSSKSKAQLNSSAEFWAFYSGQDPSRKGVLEGLTLRVQKVFWNVRLVIVKECGLKCVKVETHTVGLTIISEHTRFSYMIT